MRTNKPYYLFLILLIVIVGCFFGCKKSYTNTKSDFFAMDTYMSVDIYSRDSGSVMEEIKKAIYEANFEFDSNNTSSPLYELNKTKQLKLSDKNKLLFEAVKKGLYYSKKTDGNLDISINPLEHAYGFDSGNYRLPDKNEIESEKNKIDYNNIDISDETITLKNDARISLGAVAKGYITDVVVDILKKNDVQSGLINLGGNIYAYKDKPNGEKYVIGIEDPFNENESLGYVSVKDEAVITSGDYQRFFVENNKVYHHILDKRTGYPADNELRQVTIINGNGVMGDCLSTALFVMGKDAAIDYWHKNQDFDMVLVDKNGKIYYTDIGYGEFNNKSEHEAERIK